MNELEEGQNVTLKSLIPYFLLGAAIYLTILFLGYVAGSIHPTFAQQVSQKFQTVQGNTLRSQPVYIETVILFISNAFLGFLIIYAGYMFAQGTGHWFGSIIVTLSSATQIGAIMAYIAERVGVKLMFIAIMPHGILEFSAIFMCVGIGLMLGYHIMKQKCIDPNYTGSKLVNICLRIFAMYIIPLYLVAAIVEAYITPIIIHFAVG